MQCAHFKAHEAGQWQRAFQDAIYKGAWQACEEQGCFSLNMYWHVCVSLIDRSCMKAKLIHVSSHVIVTTMRIKREMSHAWRSIKFRLVIINYIVYIVYK